MEWLEYLARKICIVFGLSHQTFSFLADVNKAAAQSQQDIEENKGLIPLMLLLEEEYNRHILADFAPKMTMNRTNITALNLRIVFPEISEIARQMHAKETIELATKSLAGLPSQTINMVLQAMGQEPVKGGNTFYSKGGVTPWLSYDDELGSFAPKIPAGDEGSSEDEGNVETEQTGEDIGAKDDTENNETKGYVDYRRPGTRWNAGSMQLRKSKLLRS
jgi:hypothetical protein